MPMAIDVRIDGPDGFNVQNGWLHFMDSARELYWVGLGEPVGTGDGYWFEFVDDPDAAPASTIRTRRRPSRPSISGVTCGRRWMRVHAPAQWAAFCAARMLGTTMVIARGPSLLDVAKVK